MPRGGEVVELGLSVATAATIGPKSRWCGGQCARRTRSETRDLKGCRNMCESGTEVMMMSLLNKRGDACISKGAGRLRGPVGEKGAQQRKAEHAK